MPLIRYNVVYTVEKEKRQVRWSMLSCSKYILQSGSAAGSVLQSVSAAGSDRLLYKASMPLMVNLVMIEEVCKERQ